MILSVINQKGGVGKTTTTVNLAAALAALGKRVLVMDMDPQANTSTLLNVRVASYSDSIYWPLTVPEIALSDVIVETPIKGVMLAPAHAQLSKLESALLEPGPEMRLRELLVGIDFDHVVIDTAPTLGLSSAMALVASELALIAFKVEPLSTEGLAQVTRTIDVVRDRYRATMKRKILLTMLDGRTYHGPELASDIRARFGDLVCQTVIPQSADLTRALNYAAEGASVLNYAPKSPAAQAYRALAKELA